MNKSQADFRRQVIRYLKGLEEKEFAELFYEAVAGRNTSDFPERDGHFILADTQRCSYDRNDWDIDFIAIPYEDVQWAEDSPICQEGTCGSCNNVMRCWDKRAACPICGDRVHCT